MGLLQFFVAKTPEGHRGHLEIAGKYYDLIEMKMDESNGASSYWNSCLHPPPP